KIDIIDNKLIELFDSRMKYAYKIGEIKGKNDLPIHVNEREKEIFDSLKKIDTNHITENELLHLFKEIIKLGRKHGEQGKTDQNKSN
ncbi:MAG: chorismate mutase, partial [Candidatus Marinimicrobia bacterium]|nr:chorismate mutase [Candidatus Neomarinimicrobiota bacterium]